MRVVTIAFYNIESDMALHHGGMGETIYQLNQQLHSSRHHPLTHQQHMAAYRNSIIQYNPFSISAPPLSYSVLSSLLFSSRLLLLHSRHALSFSAHTRLQNTEPVSSPLTYHPWEIVHEGGLWRSVIGV